MQQTPKIIFMGTPDFAVASLKALTEGGFDVVAVVTAPDKPAGRGLKLTPSPVKVYADAQNILVLQPEKLRSKSFLQQLQDLNADLFVVVAFRMLPEVVWSMPRMGTFNLHASLLPDYRGAAPINWAVINGETETGATTFFIEKEIDTGKIIFQAKETIHPEDTAGDVYLRLMEKGASLVVKTVEAITLGNYPQIDQPTGTEWKAAPKLFREDGEIDWNQSTVAIHNRIRGLSPYPAAWTTLNGLILKVFKSEVVTPDLPDSPPGAYTSDGKSYLFFRTGDGWLSLKELQLEGKRKMSIEDLLRGYKLP
jgi:methionyl-tRNA formyltransferase